MKKHLIFCLTVICGILLMGCEKQGGNTGDQSKGNGDLSSEKTPAIVKSENAIEKPSKQANDYLDFVPHKRAPKTIQLVCGPLDGKPEVDGDGSDAVWSQAQSIETLDFSSQRAIELRAGYYDGKIYLLARYPDEAASETHKSWEWDAQEKIYKPMMDREDMLVLKWAMEGSYMGFDPDKVEPHKADIWFWKACRTNPAGYFDDKYQLMTREEADKALVVPSDKFGTLYLQRIADEGKSAYREETPLDYGGDYIGLYYPRQPEGSRADVVGKGRWQNGYWTIEACRQLNTEHDDDIQFETGKEYPFVVTLYEMACSAVEPEWWQPLYRTGNAFDRLILSIE